MNKNIMLGLLLVVGTISAANEAPKPGKNLEKASDETYYSDDVFRPGDPFYFLHTFSAMTPARRREVRERMACTKGAAVGAAATAVAATVIGVMLYYVNKCTAGQ